jgi:putative SOS response-associated peptidase YedK
MCGRYVSPDTAAIERAWQVRRSSGMPFLQRYNVLPTTLVPIIRRTADHDELELTEARWGLIPHWWKEAKAPTSTINARSEEAAGKPMWRQPYRHARCLIPALGWYEWRHLERTDPATGEVRTYKQPYYLRVDQKGPVAFAGLMATWAPSGGEPQLTCAILTRAPSKSAAEIHDRMPVVLRKDVQQDWLAPELNDAAEVEALIRDGAIDDVLHHPVRTLVNKPGTEGPELIELLASMPSS